VADIFDLAVQGSGSGIGDAYGYAETAPLPPRPHANFGDIAHNVLLDAKDIGTGLAVLPTLAYNRGEELWHGQPLIRDTDGPQLMQFGKAIVDDYAKRYVNPYLQGRPQDVLDYAAQNPLMTALDVIPGAKVLGVGKLGGKIAGGVAKSAAAGKVTKAARDVFDVAVAKMEANPATQKAVQAGKQIYYKHKLQEEFGARMGDDMANKAPDYRELLGAKKVLPKEEQAALLSAAEATHPEVLQRGYGALSEGQQAYLQQLRKVAEGTAEKAKSMGQLTDDQIFDATHSPVVKPLIRRMFGVDIDFDNVSPAQKAELFNYVRDELAKKGVKPIYQARMFEQEVQKLMNDPSTFDGKLLSTAAQRAARAAEHGKPLTGAPGSELADVKKFAWEKQRKADRGEQFHADSADLAIARDIQVSQAYHLFNTMLDRVTKEAKDVKSLSTGERAALDAGLLTEWSPRELFKSLGAEIAQSAERNGVDVLATLPEKVVLPTPMVDAIQSFSRNNSPGFIKQIANIARRYTLGFNMALPIVQGGQNLVMLALTQFNGPRNALLSMASYALALDKKVIEKIPPGMIEEMFASERQGMKMLGPAEKLVDWNFKNLAVADRYTRGVAAVQYALEMSEKMPDMKPLLTGIVTSSDAISRIEKVFNDPVATQAVSKKLLTVMGDYTSATAQKRAILRSTLLWWMWYEHVTKYAFYLPVNHPYKTSLLVHVADIARETFQDPNAPEYLNEAGAVPIKDVTNDQGYQAYGMAGGLNPVTSFFELIQQATAPFSNDTEAQANTITGGANPLIQLGMVLLAHRNPATNADFQDPRLLHAGGQQLKPEEFARGEYNPQKPIPNIAEFMGRILLGKPVRYAERIFAKATTGGEPSQFTSLLDLQPAPKKAIDANGEPVHAESWLDLARHAAIGIFPQYAPPGARQRQEVIEAQRLRKGWRSAAMQGIDLGQYLNPSTEGSNEQAGY
jgi:hypothetical protein